MYDEDDEIYEDEGVMTMYDDETKQQDETEFKQWCVVELMGRQVTAGLTSSQEIGGAPFIRVDVPAVDGRDGFTKFYNPKAVYALTPVTEEVAVVAIRNSRPVPVDPWTLRHAIAVDDDEAPF